MGNPQEKQRERRDMWLVLACTLWSQIGFLDVMGVCVRDAR